LTDLGYVTQSEAAMCSLNARLVRCAAVSFVFIAVVAHADPPPQVYLVASRAGCPTAKAVADILRQLTEADVRFDGDVELAIRIHDEGDAVEVVTSMGQRRFVDRARQCQERACAVAVFVAMTLSQSEAESAARSTSRDAHPVLAPVEAVVSTNARPRGVRVAAHFAPCKQPSPATAPRPPRRS
jgi:hypothetical protein